MAIQGVIFPNQKVSAADHAALFELFISDGIISGCGVNARMNILTISSGLFVLKGRLIKIVGSEQITIPDSIRSTTVRLTGVVDLNQISTADAFTQFSFRLDELDGGAYPALTQESINTGNGKVYEIDWAHLTVDAQGVITHVDVKIGESEGGQGGGGTSSLTAADFTFPANQYTFQTSGDNWELAFLSSGTLTLKKTLSGIDIFILGAGFDGNTVAADSSHTDHDGGDGGYYKTITGDRLQAGSYNVIIGATNGALSSIGDRAVTSSDSHKIGGLGAVAGRSGGAGVDGACAFNGDANTLINAGRKYGASGGGGGINVGGQSGDISSGLGADYGSGRGGMLGYQVDGGDALPNSGSGGGGRGMNVWNGSANVNGNPGKGGSGIIIIRNSRAA